MGLFSVKVNGQGDILDSAEASISSGFSFSTGCSAGKMGGVNRCSAGSGSPGLRPLAARRYPGSGRAFTGQHFTKKHSVRGNCSKGDGYNKAAKDISAEV